MTQLQGMESDGAAGTGGRRRFGAPPPGGVRAHDVAPFGWAPLVILVAVGIVDAMESRIIGGALQLIIDEFGISDTQAGAIPTAVTIAGAIVTLPAGYLADRYNRSNLIALVVLSWAFLLLGTALAVSFAMFFAIRVVLGAADSIDNPASGSLLGDYYPPLTRAKAFGWARLTTYAGGALGTIYGGVVGELFGWRWAYALMALPGLLCAWLCWRLREPIRGFIDQVTALGSSEPTPAPVSPDDTEVPLREKFAELGAGTARTARNRWVLFAALTSALVMLALGVGLALGRGLGGGTGVLLGGLLGAVTATACWRRRDQLRELLTPLARSTATDRAPDGSLEQLRKQLDFPGQLRYVGRIPTLRLVTLGLMAMSFGLGGIIFWVPTLMHRNFDIPISTASSLAGGVAVIGLVGGTMYGGRLGRLWHGTRKGGRLLAGGGGLFIGALLLGAALAQQSVLLFALVLLVSTAFSALAIPNLMASVADVMIASSRGIGFSLLQFLVAASAAFAPMIVGMISDATGSLLTGMYALVAPGAFGGVLVLMARKHFDRDAGLVLDAAREEADR